jgi:hypothetical protein
MNNMVNLENNKVEKCDYENDFQILTLKEKRGILKNAKTLLELQKKESVLMSGDASLHQNEKNVCII